MISYKGSQFLFDRPAYKRECLVDEEFLDEVEIVNSVAQKYGIFIYTTSSFRLVDQKVKGAIVTPAKMGNHFVGHGIDFNLLYKGKIYGSVALKKPTGDIKLFIDECVSKGVRWGGNFRKPDDIHFDSGLNLRDPEKYKIKFAQYQKP